LWPLSVGLAALQDAMAIYHVRQVFKIKNNHFNSIKLQRLFKQIP
jgi:hypothetical protein